MKFAFLLLLISGMSLEAWGQAPANDDAKTEAAVIFDRSDDLKLTDNRVPDIPNPNSLVESTVGRKPVAPPEVSK